MTDYDKYDSYTTYAKIFSVSLITVKIIKMFAESAVCCSVVHLNAFFSFFPPRSSLQKK